MPIHHRVEHGAALTRLGRTLRKVSGKCTELRFRLRFRGALPQPAEQREPVGICLPSIQRQIDIAREADAVHDATDRVATKLRAQLNLLRERRDATLLAAVTGALDPKSVAA